jgi:hypothetical protein
MVFADKTPRAAQDAVLQKSLLFMRQDLPRDISDDLMRLLNCSLVTSLIHFYGLEKI